MARKKKIKPRFGDPPSLATLVNNWSDAIDDLNLANGVLTNRIAARVAAEAEEETARADVVAKTATANADAAAFFAAIANML